jgi:hypothetical protein
MAAAVIELEKLVLELSEEERAHLAAALLDSLSKVLADPDEGVAEALRRNADLDAHPETQVISLKQLDAAIHNRRR